MCSLTINLWTDACSYMRFTVNISLVVQHHRGKGGPGWKALGHLNANRSQRLKLVQEWRQPEEVGKGFTLRWPSLFGLILKRTSLGYIYHM